MADIIKLVIAVVIGNLCTAGLVVLAIDHGLHAQFFDLTSAGHSVPADATTISENSSKQSSARYKARVPIPGHPIEYCLGPERELNETVYECTRMKVMTVSSDKPIPNPVAQARETLREVGEGKKGTSMTSKQHQEWCDMHTRIQLYGDTIRIQPATRID